MKTLLISLAFVAFGLVPEAFGASAPRARQKVFLTVDEALALAFGEADVERGTVYLTKVQRRRASKLGSVQLSSSIVHPYVARDEKGLVIGTAYFDTHRVRTLNETVLVVVDPQGAVQRIEVLAFGEPPEYVPRGAWYAQFLGKKLDEELNLKRKIRGVTGATLTARATTKAVRRVLALHEVLGEVPIGHAQASR